MQSAQLVTFLKHDVHGSGGKWGQTTEGGGKKVGNYYPLQPCRGCN